MTVPVCKNEALEVRYIGKFIAVGCLGANLPNMLDTLLFFLHEAFYQGLEHIPAYSSGQVNTLKGLPIFDRANIQ